jgi:hypothetical protein
MPSQPLSATVAAEAREVVEWHGLCDENSATDTPDCSSFGLCEVLPAAAGAEQQSCLNDPDESLSAVGYCYIDAMASIPVGDPDLVAQCPPDQRRLVRFAGAGLPANGTQLLLLCPD